MWRLTGIVSRSRLVEDPRLAALWAELCPLAGRRPVAGLLVSSEAKVPLVVCLWRPVVILPDSAGQWPSQLLRTALIHELAHIARNDLFWSGFARWVAAVYWWNPVAWYGLRRLHAEAEMAADDCVLTAGLPPVDYAENLILFVRAHRQSEGALFPAIGMARARGIESRVIRILNPDLRRLAPSRMVRLASLRGSTLLIGLLMSPLKEEWRLKMMDRLFARGADPNIGIDNPKPADYPAPSALKATMCNSKSIESGRKLFSILREHGARFPVEKDSDAEKMLIAASTGDLATVQGLLDKGVPPGVADSRGWTPLLSASALGYGDVLRALVKAGADVNAHDALGYAALYFALQRFWDGPEFRLLLDRGAEVNYGGKGVNSPTALYMAVGKSDLALTSELLKRGASPNRLPDGDVHWFDPLELAISRLEQKSKDEDRREIIKALLQYGADPIPRREKARSLLYFPVINDNLDLAKFLLGAGIDPRKERDGGKELLEQAERHGGAEMKVLIKDALGKNGADKGKSE